MIKARKRIVSKISITENNCWIWQGNPRKNGYCRTSYERKSWYIHRLSYSAFIDKIPEKMDVCHKCDIRACCNPEHLFIGTRKDNMLDAMKKGRVARGFKIPNAKLSNLDKKDILLKIKEGIKYKTIALKYNVTPSLIGIIGRKFGFFRKNINNKQINK